MASSQVAAKPKKSKPPKLPDWPIGTRVTCREFGTFARVEARISNRIALRWEHGNKEGATYTAEELRDGQIVRAAVQNPEAEDEAIAQVVQEPYNLAENVELQEFKTGDRVLITKHYDGRNCNFFKNKFAEIEEVKGENLIVAVAGHVPNTVRRTIVRAKHVSQALNGAAIAPSTFAETYEAEAQEIIASPSLTQLATQIQQAHQECEQALTVVRSAESSALEHAKRAGKLLLEAKKEVKHGGWEVWRQEQVGIPSSTASLYQRVAEYWEEIQKAGVESLKAADRHFRAAKKLKSAAGDAKPEIKSPTVADSVQEQPDDRQVVPASEIESVAHSGWIQTKKGENLNPMYYKPEQPAESLPELVEEAEARLELPQLDDALIAAHLVAGDARATIEALLWECGFMVEEEGAIPTDPSNPYKGWQIATDSPNEGMLALCLYAPWGAWWGLPTEEFFDYQDHDRAIEWTQGIVDRLEAAGERASGQLNLPENAEPEKISAMHLRTIAQDQSAALFKLLSHIKEQLPEDVDLLDVTDALEEAVMGVLEEWLLKEGE